MGRPPLRQKNEIVRPYATLHAELQEAVLVECTKLRARGSVAQKKISTGSVVPPAELPCAPYHQVTQVAEWLKSGWLVGWMQGAPTSPELQQLRAAVAAPFKMFMLEHHPLQRYHQQRQHLVSKRRIRHTPMTKLVLHSLLTALTTIGEHI